MRILVTGGCGFIGSHIAEYHLAKGDHVYVVDNLSSSNEANAALFLNNPNYQFEKADINTWENMAKVVSSADRIYHMAAVVGVLRVIQEPVNVIASNIEGTDRLFKEISKTHTLPRTIIASSSGVYGNGQPTMSEENDLIVENPGKLRSNYSISKLCDEIIGLSYDKINKIPTTVIRFFNTIGPRQTGSYGFVVPQFVKQACKDLPITVYGDGSQTRSFCDVRDVAASLEVLANNDESHGQIVNVGMDGEISILQLAQLIKARAKSKSEIRFIPYNEAYGVEFYDIMHRKPDLTKFYKLTNYKHQWTLEKTIDDLIEHYSQN